MDDFDRKKAELLLLRTKYNFEAKHGAGSVDQLLKLAHDRATTSEIGKQFGLSRSRVSNILKIFLGVPYSSYLSKRNTVRQKISRREDIVDKQEIKS